MCHIILASDLCIYSFKHWHILYVELNKLDSVSYCAKYLFVIMIINDLLPTYAGVPHAVDRAPCSSILDRPKSLMTILESSNGVSYSKFSG